MAQFTLTVPDELTPALMAEWLIMINAGATPATSPEEYFAAGVVETIRQRCEQYEVGPYFEGIAQPRFLQNGMPNPDYTGPDAVVVPPPPPEIEEGEL
jgi:hypothetical protein